MASGPEVPDAKSLSKEQTKSNVSTATAQTNLNQVNQVTPFGNLTYKQIGTNKDGTPKYQATTTLSPELQKLFTTGLGTQQSIGNTASSMAKGLGSNLQNLNNPQYKNYAGMKGNLKTNLGVDDYGAQRQQVEDALLGRVNKSYERDLGSLEQKLANQGIQRGSEAYTNAMSDYNQSLGDARTSAVLGAGQEQNRLQQLALNDANFGNNALQQQFNNQTQLTGLNNSLSGQRFNDQITANNQNINQLLSLLGGSQINSQPQFAQTPQTGIPGTDVSGNAWNAFNAQQGQSNQFWNGLGAVGSGLGSLFFSDKRLKEDIKDTGMETPGGVPIKDWRYKGSPMMMRGVVAQDVQKSGQRDAVKKMPGGFLAVDYRRVK